MLVKFSMWFILMWYVKILSRVVITYPPHSNTYSHKHIHPFVKWKCRLEINETWWWQWRKIRTVNAEAHSLLWWWCADAACEPSVKCISPALPPSRAICRTQSKNYFLYSPLSYKRVRVRLETKCRHTIK